MMTPPTTITRSHGGTAAHEVPLATLTAPEFAELLLFLPDRRWLIAAELYQRELAQLLAGLRGERVLPASFFVPDFWHSSTCLPKQDGAILCDAWGLGYDLARAAMYQTSEIDGRTVLADETVPDILRVVIGRRWRCPASGGQLCGP